jgi:hypothetical protein
MLIKEISKFIQKIGMELEKVNGKKEAEGYLDIIRGIKNLKLEF